MKKILLVATLLLNCSLMFGQVIEKDQRILGGTINLGYNHSQADTLISSKPSLKGSNLYLNLSPSFGRATRKNLVFGYLTSLNYSHSNSEDLRSKETGKSNGYGVGTGLFYEKYFPLGKSFSFSGMLPLQVSYNSSQNKIYDNGTLTTTSTNKHYGASISLYPSLNYSLNNKFMLQLTLNNFASFGYGRSTSQVEGPNIIANKQGYSNIGFNTRVNEQTRLSDMGFAFRYIF